MRNAIFPNVDTGAISIMLDSDFVADCRQRAVAFAKFHHKDWQTTYKRGLLNSKEKPNETERFGAMGEQAFHLLTGLDIDRKVRSTGNRHDFLMKRDDDTTLRIEVTCKVIVPERMSENSRHTTKFYRKAREHPSKPLLKLNADLFVFGVINDWSESHGVVRFEKWATRELFVEHAEVGSSMRRDSTHENYYINPQHLLPMLDFMWDYRDGFSTDLSELFW